MNLRLCSTITVAAKKGECEYTSYIWWRTQELPEMLKYLFKTFIQVWNFSHLQSTASTDRMQWTQCRSHKSSMEMLSSAVSDSRSTSATSAKRLLFKSWFVPGNIRKSQGRRSGDWGCGWGWKHHFVFGQKGGDLLTLQRLNENCWGPLRTFLLKNLDNVSSSGRGAGIAASSHWGQYFEGD